MRICNGSKEDIAKKLCDCDDIMIALCDESKCIAIWFDFYLNAKEITDEQFRSLELLKRNKCINPMISLSKEPGFHYLELNNF